MPEISYRKSGYHDLGIIDEPVMVFGGPYSNLQATTALMRTAADLGILADRMICTGDIVAYCAAPAQTTDVIRQSGVHAIQGNCEISLSEDADDCGCGFEEGSTCDRLSAHWFDYARQQMGKEARDWMGKLPRQIRFRMNGKSFAVVHGSASDVSRFVFPSTPTKEKLSEINLSECDGVICGHSGLPFTQIMDGLLWHNAGVIGMPANDGTPRSWFSLIEPTYQGISVRHIALEYDHKGARDDMKQALLPEEYSKALTTGLWDNCDILPEKETAQQGKPLSFQDYLWPNMSTAAE